MQVGCEKIHRPYAMTLFSLNIQLNDLVSIFKIKYEEVQVKEEPQSLEEVDEARKEQGRWSHRQHQEQQALVLGEGAETAQLLGFCDPGLNYLAHTSGLGAVTDRGHSSHHHRNIHAVSGENREKFVVIVKFICILAMFEIPTTMKERKGNT